MHATIADLVHMQTRPFVHQTPCTRCQNTHSVMCAQTFTSLPKQPASPELPSPAMRSAGNTSQSCSRPRSSLVWRTKTMCVHSRQFVNFRKQGYDVLLLSHHCSCELVQVSIEPRVSIYGVRESQKRGCNNKLRGSKCQFKLTFRLHTDPSPLHRKAPGSGVSLRRGLLPTR